MLIDPSVLAPLSRYSVLAGLTWRPCRCRRSFQNWVCSWNCWRDVLARNTSSAYSSDQGWGCWMCAVAVSCWGWRGAVTGLSLDARPRWWGTAARLLQNFWPRWTHFCTAVLPTGRRPRGRHVTVVRAKWGRAAHGRTPRTCYSAAGSIACHSRWAWPPASRWTSESWRLALVIGKKFFRFLNNLYKFGSRKTVVCYCSAQKYSQKISLSFLSSFFIVFSLSALSSI